MKILAKHKRQRLREVARQEYSVACRLHADFSSEKKNIAKMAIRSARTRLSQSTEYGGILNTVFLALATKLIVALIEQWIDQNINARDLPESYQQGEPGYE